MGVFWLNFFGFIIHSSFGLLFRHYYGFEIAMIFMVASGTLIVIGVLSNNKKD